MTPYFSHGGIEIYQGDCREVMPSLNIQPDSLIVADPPYNQTSLAWDKWPTGWPEVAARTASSMWCFGSLKMFLDRAGEFSDWKFGQDIVWEKPNGSNFHADRFRRVHEQVVHWYRGKWDDVFKSPQFTADATKRATRRKRRPAHMGNIDEGPYLSEDGGPRMQRSVLRSRSCHGFAENETQKPEGIVEALVRYSAKPGGVVIDPFVGSGTTLVVAKFLGLRAIGIELREEQCEVAANRVTGSMGFPAELPC